MQLVYLNNAATSFPRPDCVGEAMLRTMNAPPSENGRAGRGDALDACRAAIAKLLGAADPRQVALMPSATHALNAVLAGELRPGDHVVTTVLEHNSVLRPIAHRVDSGAVTVTYLRPGVGGAVDATSVLAALQPNTRLVALTHASNVTGSVQPVEAIAAVLAARGVSLLVDAAQSAGALPIDHARLAGRVYIAFAGHKGLYGPPGTGGMIVPDDALPQTLAGGTGIRSESRLHPCELPLRHEAGTPNLPGIAGLLAGVRFVLERGIRELASHRSRLVQAIRRGLAEYPAVHQTPLAQDDGRAGVTSFWLDSAPSEQVRYALMEGFGVETRAGLHCAPLMHEHLGTAPAGCVRVSVGAFNDEGDVGRLLAAVRGVLVQ